MELSKLESVVLNALRLAARQFEVDAKNAEFPKRLREQFIEQTADALRACELIEVGRVVFTEKDELADDSCSAASSSPLTGEHADGAPHRAATPAVAGNSGGIPLVDVILRTTREWECANGFVHPVGFPCLSECAP